MKSVSRLTIIALLISSMLCAAGSNVFAADFPQKPLTLIVPWSPGGSGDMTCRILAAQMQKDLGKPVVVKNMPGAGSMVGAKALADASADGYTLGFLGISAAIAQYTSVSPVMMDEYKPVGGIINPELVLLVNAKSPWKTFEEFLAYAKENPGKIKNANAGAGVIDHLYSSKFGKVAEVEFTQVPYKGWGPSLAALAGGHVDSMFVAIGPAKALIKAGKIRPLAISSAERHPSFPDLPTMKEGGVDIVMDFWESIVVPAGTTDEIVTILDESLASAFANESVQEKIKNSGLDLAYMPNKEFVSFRTEADKQVRAMVEAVGLLKK